MRYPVTRSTRLWLLAGLGALSIVPVMLASAFTLPLAEAMASTRAQIAVLAFIGSSLPEEAVRFGLLYAVGWRWIGIARPRDGIVCGLLAALGFSAAENLFYGLSIGWATGSLKLVVATPIHLALGVTMGGFLAIAALTDNRRGMWLAAAFGAPLLLHGGYDFVLFSALADSDAATVQRLALPALVYLLIAATAILTVLRSRQTSLPA
jgi:RsiW-degrading membrane proteinase PrsW (M82 family)